MLKNRCCEICGGNAEFISASFVRVLFFCQEHGQRFHMLSFLWDGDSTEDVLARIDLWIRMKRGEFQRGAVLTGSMETASASYG